MTRWRRALSLAGGAVVLALALAVFSHPASASGPGPRLVATATPTTAPTATTTPSPEPVQVGPPTTTVPGQQPGGGAVSGGKAPSPGLFDITGHIEAAIDAWFRDLVTGALNPVLDLLGHTLLATPDVTAQGRVGELWQMAAGVADGTLVLFVLVGGAVVMSHESLQTRWALKEVLPRILVAAVAVNASLSLAGLAISLADSLSQALLGQGVGPAQAEAVLAQLILGSLSNGGIFLVLVGAVVAVLALVLLATYVVRLALVVILVVAAPLALVCHALPQTEGAARLWWRAFGGLLTVQVAQSLVLVAALRVFLATGGPSNLGLTETGGLVDLLVSACLCWVLVRIPVWVSRAVFSGGRGRGHHVVRDVVVYKAVKAIAAVGAGA